MSLLSRRPAVHVPAAPVEPEPIPEPVPAAAVLPEPDPVKAATLARDAAAQAIESAHAEVEAAAADTVLAADFSGFPGDDTAAAVAQLTAQRAAARRGAGAAAALTRAEQLKAEADQALAAEVRAELVKAAESFHWGLEWAGRALLVAVKETPTGYPVQVLAAADSLARQSVAYCSALQVELTEAGIQPAAAPRLSIGAALADLLAPEPGLLGVFLTAANVVRWQADLPRREKEIADNAARAEADALAHDRRMALSGHMGPEAAAQAHAAQRAELAGYYGRATGACFMPAPSADLVRLHADIALNTRAEVE